jgi:uncharacterized SAM-binding protein YcdF (DUF218 family)
MRTRTVKLFFIFLLVIAAALFLYRRPLLIGMGDWLVAQTRVERADLVVALGGGPERREAAAVYLSRGWARRILFVGSDIRPEDYRSMNIPAGKTVAPAAAAATTYEEALAVRKVVAEHRLRSVLVVTSDFHLRRARLTFERVLQDSGVDLMFVAAPRMRLPAAGWWNDYVWRKKVLREYAGLIVYFFTV